VSLNFVTVRDMLAEMGIVPDLAEWRDSDAVVRYHPAELENWLRTECGFGLDDHAGEVLMNLLEAMS